MEHLGIQTIRISGRLMDNLYLTKDDIYIANINTTYPRICDIICTMHTHNFYYLVWIEKGGFKYYVDVNEYDVQDNSILMLSPGQMHRFASVSGASGLAIHFTESFFRNLNSDLANYIKNNIMKDVPVLHICEKRNAEKIKRLIGDIENLCDKREKTMSSAVCTYSTLTLLLCVIGDTKEYKDLKLESKANENPNRSLYLDFMQLVESNFNKHHMVHFYAERLNVSLNILNECCKTNAAMTPYVVISNRIIQEAKRLLLFTEMRSGEIAALLGFSEQSNFVNYFKRFVNLSPTEFRNINKQK